jgi:hypothetical protein
VRLRINSVALVGTSREVAFEPGLNVIEGPISTGKTALMRLLTVLLGGPYDGINPEVDESVSELAGEFLIEERTYSIVRRLVQTDTAPVQIAGDGVAERLPAMRAVPGSTRTYGTWLLETLGLPTLRVPQAPTRPAESAFIPVSISDYVRYCRLRQDEIDVDVLGSSQHFRDIKRRYVFRILYGGYDVEVAQLQEELRRTDSELRQLQQGTVAFDRFLEGTALENRAEITRRLTAAHEQKAQLDADREALAAQARTSPEANQLREELMQIDLTLAERNQEIEREQGSARQLRELSNELQTQSLRLTKAIVAGERFFDFDFIVCPRCGSGVSQSRSEAGYCYLCMQEPPPAPSREDLIGEQDRLNAQIGETEDLIQTHEQRTSELMRTVQDLAARRENVSNDLDRHMTSFVSAEAERIEALTRGKVQARALIERLEDYLRLFEKLDQTTSRIDELNARRAELEAALERAEQLDAVTATRLERLEAWFLHYVEALEVPVFGGGPRAAIDHNDYEPIINGRKFPQLSAGVRVLVNIAHLLAHHRAALELELLLPGLLMIDGINKNIGTAEYDAARIDDAWTQLMELSETLGDEMQIVVAANDVPERARSFVRLTLSAEDRLIPTADLRTSRG